jgi:hypothetical protein
LKQKPIKNLKVEFPKKLRNSLGEKGYEKLAAKVGMFFSTQSHANNLAKTGNRTGDPALIYLEKL